MTSPPVDPIFVTVGDAMPESTEGPLTRTHFVRYAGASGDFNPAHHDDEYARRAGFDSVFGMGMLHAGMLGLKVAQWLGPQNIEQYSVRFTGRVLPGDTLRFTGTVENIETGAAGPVATLRLIVERAPDEAVLTATAVARIGA